MPRTTSPAASSTVKFTLHGSLTANATSATSAAPSPFGLITPGVTLRLVMAGLTVSIRTATLAGRAVPFALVAVKVAV